MTRLSPGDVLTTIPAWASSIGYAPWVPPLAIVGASAQLSDDDDATYADIDYDNTAYPTPDDSPAAIVVDFPAATIPAGSVVTASLRAQWLDPVGVDGTTVQLYVYLLDRTTMDYLMTFNGNFALVELGTGGFRGHDFTDGEVATVTLPWDIDGTLFIDAFAAGNASAVIFNNTGDPRVATIRVFEFWFDVAGAVTGRRPHTRIHPRDDNRGPSPRIFPPPQSQQTIGRISGYL